MRPLLSTHVRVLILIAAAMLLPAHPALAAFSGWQDLGGGKARLAIVHDPATGEIRGVVEVQLEPGWKTYWRSPGSSGIPPEFDFSASRDVLIDTVGFPVPEMIEAGGSRFIGYRERVLFPFAGEASGTAPELKLELLIGVCEEVCIPATASLAIGADAINSSDPRAEMLSELARGSLPPDGSKLLKQPASAQIDDTSARLNLALNGDGIAEGSRLKAVLWLPGVWTSDPLEATGLGGGMFEVSAKIPGSVAEMAAAAGRWHYALFQEDLATGRIEKLVEDSIDVQH